MRPRGPAARPHRVHGGRVAGAAHPREAASAAAAVAENIAGH